METSRCPECGRPAEVVDRFVLDSTDGPVEHAHVRCVDRHHFRLPVEYLAREPRRPAAAVGGGVGGPDAARVSRVAEHTWPQGRRHG